MRYSLAEVVGAIGSKAPIASTTTAAVFRGVIRGATVAIKRIKCDG